MRASRLESPRDAEGRCGRGSLSERLQVDRPGPPLALDGLRRHARGVVARQAHLEAHRPLRHVHEQLAIRIREQAAARLPAGDQELRPRQGLQRLAVAHEPAELEVGQDRAGLVQPHVRHHPRTLLGGLQRPGLPDPDLGDLLPPEVLAPGADRQDQGQLVAPRVQVAKVGRADPRELRLTERGREARGPGSGRRVVTLTGQRPRAPQELDHPAPQAVVGTVDQLHPDLAGGVHGLARLGPVRG